MAKFLGFNIGREQRAPEPTITPQQEGTQFYTVPYQVTTPYDNPVMTETTRGWVEYSTPGSHDNEYPEYLLGLLNTALHGSIVKQKGMFMAGKQFLVDGKPLKEWTATAPVEEAVEVNSFLRNSLEEDLTDVKDKVALDYSISGSFALEIIWAKNFSRIVRICYIPWNRLRPEVMDTMDRVNHYYYSRDWKRSTSSGDLRKIQAFDPRAHVPDGKVPKDHPYRHNQVLFVKNHWPNYDYFGRPYYQGALGYIATDMGIVNFYKTAVSNGFTGALSATIIEPKNNFEARKKIYDDFNNQYSALGKGRRNIINFATSPELAPVFQALDVKNLDRTIIEIQNHVQSAILTGHGITSPELVGVAVAGRLGTSGTTEAWRQFYDNIIVPEKERIERTFQTLARFNGITAELTFENSDKTYIQIQ